MKVLVLAKSSLISCILFGIIGTLHAKEESDEWSIKHIVVGGVLGAVAMPLLAVGATALIPVAMTTYGTVVVGVGTTHASLAAGGCAALLQSTAATLVTTSATAAGAAIGATVALVTKDMDDDNTKTKTRKKK